MFEKQNLAIPKMQQSDTGFFTTRLGAIPISECIVTVMPEGLLGFEDNKQYFIAPLQTTQNIHFKILQSLEDKGLCFIMMPVDTNTDPQAARVMETITPILERSDMDPTQVDLYLIVSIEKTQHKTSMSVNLKAPIIFHKENNHAWQIVLEDPSYPVDFKIFEHHS
jgi:flagellar assembly factor FliW